MSQDIDLDTALAALEGLGTNAASERNETTNNDDSELVDTEAIYNGASATFAESILDQADAEQGLQQEEDDELNFVDEAEEIATTEVLVHIDFHCSGCNGLLFGSFAIN